MQKKEITPTKKTTGRPRSEESKQAIFEATIALIDEVGYNALTIESIARSAGVGKMTIYRWWKNKDNIILDIFLEMTNVQVKFVDQLSIYKNFAQIITGLINVYQSSIGRATLRIMAFSEIDSEIYQRYRDGFLQPRRDSARDVLKVAKEQNRISENADIDMVLDMIFGPVYLRMLTYKDIPDAQYQKRLVQYILGGIEKEACDI